MAKAIRVHEVGGPEALVYEDYDPGSPGEGQVLLRQTAIGVNYLDVYFRSGLYKAPAYPFVLGSEGAGEVIALGEGVTAFAVGDRVAYGTAAGSYCDERVVDAKTLLKLPDSISDETGAAMMLKGLTAQYLLRRTFAVKRGDTIVFHAAAGGVGLIACQWAKRLGCTVIGTVGSQEKVALAKEHGCDHVIVTKDEDIAKRVREITNGEGVPVVYDGVGAATFAASLDCLMPFGVFVSFGSASGPIKAFDIGILSQKGSLYATRPTLFTHAAKREVLDEMAEDLFDVVGKGAVTIPIHLRSALKDAADVHRALEGRKTTGSTILIP